MGELLSLIQRNERRLKSLIMPEEQKDRIMSKVLILMSNSNANINVIAF